MVHLEIYGKYMENIWKIYGKYMENIWKRYGKYMENIWKIYGKDMENIWKISSGWWLQPVIRCENGTIRALLAAHQELLKLPILGSVVPAVPHHQFRQSWEQYR